jgi:hypothetical protein
MTRNKSIFLVGIFFLIVIIFGAVFWQMFNRNNDEAFDKIKKEAKVGLTGAQVVPSAQQNSTAADALAGATSEAGTETPKDTQASVSGDATKTPEDKPEESKDETADWEVYADEKKKFEFKYPPNASVTPSGDLIRISQERKIWKMRLFFNKDKSDLATWYNEEFSDKERKNCTLSESATLKVGSYETKYANPNSGDSECTKAGYFSVSSDKKYVIRLELGSETVENANKILKTFKFLTE